MIGAEAGGMEDHEAIEELLKGLEKAESMMSTMGPDGLDVEAKREEEDKEGRRAGKTDMEVSTREELEMRELWWTDDDESVTSVDGR